MTPVSEGPNTLEQLLLTAVTSKPCQTVILAPYMAFHDFGICCSGRKPVILANFAQSLSKPCSEANKQIRVKPPPKFRKFCEDFNFFWIFWFLTIFGRVVHLNVMGDFGLGRKIEKIVIFRRFRPNFGRTQLRR